MGSLIGEEIERINQLLPESSQIRRFANFPKQLDPDEGELTRTRKLRREFLEDRYSQLINALYQESHEVALKIPVTYQDGRSGVLSAVVAVYDVGTVADLPSAETQATPDTLTRGGGAAS